jgi:hypothetical protein
VLALVPVSAKNQPLGTELDVPEEASESRFSVYVTPSAVMETCPAARTEYCGRPTAEARRPNSSRFVRKRWRTE